MGGWVLGERRCLHTGGMGWDWGQLGRWNRFRAGPCDLLAHPGGRPGGIPRFTPFPCLLGSEAIPILQRPSEAPGIMARSLSPTPLSFSMPRCLLPTMEPRKSLETAARAQGASALAELGRGLYRSTRGPADPPAPRTRPRGLDRSIHTRGLGLCSEPRTKTISVKQTVCPLFPRKGREGEKAGRRV